MGEGNSGIVYKGRIHSLPDPVAFKTLKVDASVLDLKNLLSEIKIISYVGRHDNIVNLLGAHTAKIEQGMSNLVVSFPMFSNPRIPIPESIFTNIGVF